MIQDTAIPKLIEQERNRQTVGVELIASENYASPQVIRAMGTILTNKYAEGYPGKRYYGGCEFIDEIEQLAINRLCELFGAEFANVQPHSGAQANAAVFLAILQPGDPILGFDLAHGGHLSHGSPVNFSGLVYDPHFYGVERDSGRIDMEKVREKALSVKPKLIICGASAYSRDWDYEAFRSIADEVGAVLLADIAHPAGLIAKGLLKDPLPHCHIVSSTTHKTLRGPRGGIIMVGKNSGNTIGKLTKSGKSKRWGTLINSAVFPGMQGGPLEHVIASKALAFHEALQPSFKTYVEQVQKNASIMAREFNKRGYDIISGGTDNHMMLIDLQSKNVTGKEAEIALGKTDITVNKNMVPFDPQPPMISSGIRVGSPAITSRGLQEADCMQVVEWIDETINNRHDEAVLNSIKQQINSYMSKFPLHQ